MKFGTKFGTNEIELPISPFVKSNRLFVFVKAPFQPEKKIVSIGTDMDSAIPHDWDRNFSSNAFEVVNGDTNPVLQVFYRRSNEVQVNGIFFVNGFDQLVSFGGFAPTLFSASVRVSDNQTTQDFTPESFVHTFTNFGVLFDTNNAYRVRYGGQKPIFKYPGWKHPGEYAD